MFKPFDHLVLIKKVEEKKVEKTVGGLYVPDSGKQASRFWKARVIEIGTQVVLPIETGDLVMCNAASEIDNFFSDVEKGHMLIMDHHILGKWVDD